MKNTRKGIISIKTISFGDQIATDLQIISNILNSFFYSVAPEVQSQVLFSCKSFL